MSRTGIEKVAWPLMKAGFDREFAHTLLRAGEIS
jgi:hypothetical protein